MPTRKKSQQRRQAVRREVTAQPRARSEAIATDPDENYAMTPEDLGEHALREATQSGWPPADVEAHWLGTDAVSDVPLSGRSYLRGGADILTETIELALEYAAPDAYAALATGRRARHGRATDDFDKDDAEQAHWARDIDLRQPKVVEASLFDPGSEETIYEHRKPRIYADNDSPEHTRLGPDLPRRAAAKAHALPKR